jgi:hypothetical protein
LKKCFKKRIVCYEQRKKVVAHLVFVTFFANGYIIKGCFGLFGRSEIEAERKKIGPASVVFIQIQRGAEN